MAGTDVAEDLPTRMANAKNGVIPNSVNQAVTAAIKTILRSPCFDIQRVKRDAPKAPASRRVPTTAAIKEDLISEIFPLLVHAPGRGTMAHP